MRLAHVPRLGVLIAWLTPIWALGQSPAAESAPGYLGIVFRVVDDGVQVVEVRPGTPAEKHGLAAGDVLLRYDQIDLRGIATTEAFRRHFAYLRPGAEVPAVVRSGDRVRELTVILGERPVHLVRAHQPPPEQVILAEAFERLHRIASMASRDGYAVCLRTATGRLEIGAPAHELPFRELTEGERLLVERMQHGSDALEKASIPDVCVRLWFDVGHNRLGIERFTDAVDVDLGEDLVLAPKRCRRRPRWRSCSIP